MITLEGFVRADVDEEKGFEISLTGRFTFFAWFVDFNIDFIAFFFETKKKELHKKLQFSLIEFKGKWRLKTLKN